jgi:hypothetical protein
MTAKNLGRLKSVPLRSVWQNEAFDFTPWLAIPENLELLGETLGLAIELLSKEPPVAALGM